VFNAIDGGGWIATHEDITERQRIEDRDRSRADQLARLNMQLDIALESMSQGLCLFNPDQTLALSNRRFREIYGLAPDQVRPGTDMRRILGTLVDTSVEGERRIEQRARHMLATDRETVRLLDGRTIAIQRTPTPDGGWVGVHDDVTERELANRQISHLAYHDALTGLANRAEFKLKGESAVIAALQDNASLALLLVDLDRFKAVNDTMGHASGDMLLQAVAQRLSDHVRADDIVARLGGDEFAIIQRPAPDQHAAASALAARLVTALGQPFDLGGQAASIGASIGVAVLDGRQTIEQLMHQADLALYQVKAAGRDGFQLYESVLGAREQDRRRLGIELREAIARDELTLHYQPIVALADGAVLGVEALVRWPHPLRGQLAPDQFIPLAEECDLIVPLGEFVIRRACADAMAWPDHIKVAINISPSHIRQRTLFDSVSQALLATGLPPERLEVEVTETVLLQNDEGVLDELHALRGIGVSIALDDFGTGYSSLSHLRMFSFDKIKIDRLFVAEITERSDSAAIVAAVLGLARALGITVTAEGIETEMQRRVLQAAGCMQGQGWLFGRPQPRETIGFAAPAGPVARTG
jgi:diguanylate cyclase (GGDEF)-like protein